MSSGGTSTRHPSTRRAFFIRHKPDRDRTAFSNSPARSEAWDAYSLTRDHKSKTGADDPADIPGAESKHLDMGRFLTLPLSVIAQVCMYLQFQDLTNLSRTSPGLRRLFMSKISKPCWDAARWLQNMPEWTGVAAPRAAAFIFDDACQGEGCKNSAKLRTFYVVKRYCPDCAPTYLLDWDAVPEKWPGIHQEMFRLLPWTRKRASKNNGDVETGRFVLREDVERLQNRIQQMRTEDQAEMTQLKEQLKEAWKKSQRIAQWMETWTRGYEGRIWHATNKRFIKFFEGLEKRWGWNIARLPAVRDSPQFFALINFAQDAPELDHKVWDRAEVVIKSIIEEDSMNKQHGDQPWSLGIPQSLHRNSKTPGTSSSKGKRR